MHTYVALLRGVNVGKANRVPMATLREVLCDLGYEGVKTLMNSGNAVFRAASGTGAWHGTAISRALAGLMSVEVPVVVKSAKDLATVVLDNPFAGEVLDHSRLLVALTQDQAALSSLCQVQALVSAPERFAVGRQAAYLYCACGVLESAAARVLLAPCRFVWNATALLDGCSGAERVSRQVLQA